MGTVWPLLVNDGRALSRKISERYALTSYETASDQQAFLALDSSASLLSSQPLVRSTYGDLLPVIYSGKDVANRTFIYPRQNSRPSAEEVLRSFEATTDGFHSALGRVERNVYVGKTIAGGVARELSLISGGAKDVRFSSECGFLVQLAQKNIVAVETDRAVHATIQGKEYDLAPYSPRRM